MKTNYKRYSPTRPDYIQGYRGNEIDDKMVKINDEQHITRTGVIKKNPKKKEVKPFSYVLDYNKAEQTCPNDCNVVTMRSFSRMGDNFYVFVPKKGLYFRPANSSRYGSWKVMVFVDGRFIGASDNKKRNNIRRLYEADDIGLEDYIRGYKFFRETKLGGSHINKYKESARISHQILFGGGKEGHEARKIIRRG